MERAGAIIVVEDEPDIRNLVAGRLEREGFRVIRIADGAEAMDRIPALSPALVVLDLMLPDASGEEVCRSLRAHPDTKDVPILILTARGEEADLIAGFEIGADDYMTKPFSVRELIVRIRALLRRAGAAGQAPGELQTGRLDIDFRTRRVWVENAEVVLSPNEFRVLVALARKAGEAVPREVLAAALGQTPSARSLDEELATLREKLGPLAHRLEVEPEGVRLRTPRRSG